ncbi:flagellar filament capping protein FliD [bacterium]|nr:flagellar filament capping protein FliD [bacterium]
MVDLGISGLISGLDVNSIIDALVEAERAPITRLEDRRSLQNTRLTAFQNLSARLLSLQVAAGRLGQSATTSGRRISVSDTSILSATVSSSALAGAYSVRVEQLARAQQFSSGSFADQNAALGLSGEFLINGRRINVKTTDSIVDVARQINSVFAGVTASAIRVAEGDYRLIIASNTTGEGSVDLRNVGGSDILAGLLLTDGATSIRNPIANGAASQTWSSDTAAIAGLLNLTTAGGGTIQIDEGNGNVISVALDLSTQSLSDIAAAINDAVAAFNAGGPDTPSQISAAVTGTSGAFKLEITGVVGSPGFVDDGNVLETLGVLTPGLVQEDQAGRNAVIRLNNIQIERSSNVISDLITGVTLALADDSKSNQTVLVTVTEDTGVATDAIQSFVSAFNAVREFINSNSGYNTDTREAGIFLGDFTAQGIEAELFRQVGRRVNAAIGASLASLNNGAGVDRGSIVITNRAGTSATIDLTSANTLADVVNAINRASNLKVTASLSDQGTGLQLVDNSGGTGSLSVVESGGSTAADLGLLSVPRRPVGRRGDHGGALHFAGGHWRAADGHGHADRPLIHLAGLRRQCRSWAVRILLSQGSVGIGPNFSASLSRATGTTSGTIKIRTDAIGATIRDINKSISRYEERIEAYEARLVRQFSEMERRWRVTRAISSPASYWANNLRNR